MLPNLFERNRIIIWFISDKSCCVIVFLCFSLLNEKISDTSIIVLKSFSGWLVFWAVLKSFLSPKFMKSFDLRKLDGVANKILLETNKYSRKKKSRFNFSHLYPYHIASGQCLYIRNIKNFGIFFFFFLKYLHNVSQSKLS